MTPLRSRGAMGGGLPSTSLLATVVAPLWGGPRAHGPSSLAVSPVGAGANPNVVGWPEAQWPPLGGKYTLERQRVGG